jgi:SAM-dependent methyltransferase
MPQINKLPTTRFSNRVADYVKYRPGYPENAIEFIAQTMKLNDESIVADIGSGTGLSSKPFLEQGMMVFGVEPNKEMREAGEAFLTNYQKFVSHDGTAEATGLVDHSIDVIIAAQAFHWFSVAAAKDEARRILKPSGYVVLLWNERLTDSTPFLREYEQLLKIFGTDYAKVDHRNVDEIVLNKFFDGEFELAEFRNVQHFDYDGLEGRLRSSSYVPAPVDPQFAPMIAMLEALFQQFEEQGAVDIEYTCKVYWGKV